MRYERLVSTLAVGVFAVMLHTVSAEAGCGCTKPPPVLAQFRPNATYAGTPITFFDARFIAGQRYTVRFASSRPPATSVDVNGTVVVRRDLADGVSKPQLQVLLPAMPIGPVSIQIRSPGMLTPFITIDDAQFTVTSAPLVVPATYGTQTLNNFQAAVGRDGTVYLALDVTNIQLPMVFEAQAVGYGLRFSAQDVLFHNAQGFLMQALVQGAPNAREPVPGMFILPSASTADSDILHYSRHEFSTYFLQHAERQPHAVDPTDGNWHLDGTYHVDHNHLILAISGRENSGNRPAPGATPSFTLVTKTYSLFYQGLVGASSVTMANNAQTNAFSPTSNTYTAAGDAYSNGAVTLNNWSVVNGNATGASFMVAPTAKITGSKTLGSPMSFMAVKLPDGLPNLGSINLNWWQNAATITGPGSFQVKDIQLGGFSTLTIDNSKGPVTLYVTGTLSVLGNARILPVNSNPEWFAMYVTSALPVTLQGSSIGKFYGVLYAPTSAVSISGNADFFGAFVGQSMFAGGSARIHYYRPLRGN